MSQTLTVKEYMFILNVSTMSFHIRTYNLNLYQLNVWDFNRVHSKLHYDNHLYIVVIPSVLQDS